MRFVFAVLAAWILTGCAGCRQTRFASGDAEFPQTERWWR